jgi:hypothetical protein
MIYIRVEVPQKWNMKYVQDILEFVRNIAVFIENNTR